MRRNTISAFRYPPSGKGRPQVLLIGNGLERTEGQPDWDALLDALDVMTDGRMDTFLADLVRKYRFTRVSRPVFEAEALAACGVDIAPLMTDWLDTYMIEKGV